MSTKNSISPIYQATLLSGVILLTSCQFISETPRAVSVIQAKSGSGIQGSMSFTQSGNNVNVTGTFSGLTPNSEHGIHIHENGDCSTLDASSAGGHYNPNSGKHGKHNNFSSHAGDMPNIKVDSNGNSNYSATLSHFSLVNEQNILGKSVVVHRNKDDYVTQPSGNSGERIGCGIIR